MSWKEEIDKFQTPHSKILYMIYYYYKNEELNDPQRIKLKEYVILEEEKIFNLLSEFEETEDDVKFLQQMKLLYDEEMKLSSNETDFQLDNDENSNYIKNSAKKNTTTILKNSYGTEKSIEKNTIHKHVTIHEEEYRYDANEICHKAQSLQKNKKMEQHLQNSINNIKNNFIDNEKLIEESDENEQENITALRKSSSKFEIYKKSFLGRAVGTLSED